ncbi:MAG: endopeptidase La [Thiotrichales bacterium]|nr:MAG: endopeptidase La [Thiotrichales bacterium]
MSKRIVAVAASQKMPIVPVRDVVMYPYVVLSLCVGRERSVNAINMAMKKDQKLLFITQKDSQKEAPLSRDLHRVGTVVHVLQLLRLPDGSVKILVEGMYRASVAKFLSRRSCIMGDVVAFNDILMKHDDDTEALMRSVISQFEQYVKLNKKIPPEVVHAINDIPEAGKLADVIASHILLKVVELQKILEIQDVQQRILYLMEVLENEIDLLIVENKIRRDVKSQVGKTQREYYLHEQLKAIQKELGHGGKGISIVDDLQKQAKSMQMTKNAAKKVDTEIEKLRSMQPTSAEFTVVRNYIDTMLSIPWKKISKVNNDLKVAQDVLDTDHYGLEKVKERIMEHLAVLHRVPKLKGPIICLVGPPGVGKTSLASSIARATGRKFAKISLGGMRDEAEIRGHRRTYIGSMPGKIVQSLVKTKVRNPLILLDEIDKMAADFRGDPSSALMEVLDPEQNNMFSDHYVELDYDLSDVMFVATANTLNAIPFPLLDRMEVIRLSSYTEIEKEHIALKYLIPKVTKETGLQDGEIQFSKEIVRDIIRFYTREAGVRNLEREINKLCRKAVKAILLNGKKTKSKSQKAEKFKLTVKNLEKYLGVKKYRVDKISQQNHIGQVNGLAWTEVGGEMLKIESAVMPGKGKLLRTGKLGEVMQESIQAAITVVRERSKYYNIAKDFYEKHDIHVHVPEGAIPKDGPSAGVAMCTALVSAITKRPIRADVAMTGEITLRGEILPIGGLKEKLIAAHTGGIKTVIIPEENRRDLKEIPAQVQNGLEILPMQWVDDVLAIALVKDEKPKVSTKTNKGVASK